MPSIIKTLSMKKNLLLLLAIVSTALSASAQISKGSSFLGGTLNFSTQKETSEQPTSTGETTSIEEKKSTFLISPSIGFAYKENRVWGLSLSYNRVKNEYADNKPSVENYYGAGAFLRQYKPLGKGFYLFAEESLGFSYGKNDYTSDNNNSSSYKLFSTALSFAPGFAYDVSKKFQLELIMNNLLYAKYNHSDAKTSIADVPRRTQTSNFSVGSNLNGLLESNSISIGGRFVFGR